MERVFYVENDAKELVFPVRPQHKVFVKLNGLKRRLCGLVGYHSRVSMQKCVDMYKGRKKTLYANALETCRQTAFQNRWANVKNFIKMEKLNLTKKPDPAPRVISPRTPQYNLHLATYLKPFEHDLYRAIDKLWGGPTVMKGYTVEEVGQQFAAAWDQFRSPCAIGFDMKRFDQHVSVEALRFEHSVYLTCFNNDPHLQRLLELQINNNCTAYSKEGMLRYKTKGVRMSGDLNTSMGNVLLACLITKHIVRKVRCRLLNNGDDCVLICDKDDLPRIGNLYDEWAKFGFHCVAEEPVFSLPEVEFCQMHPVHDGKTWLMARNPWVCISKDQHSLIPWTTIKVAKQCMKSNGMCGLSLTGGLPMLQEFYQCLIRNTADVKLNKNLQEQSAAGYYGMEKTKRGYQPVLDVARHTFYLAFGITPDEQVAIEEDFKCTTINWDWAPSGSFAELYTCPTFTNLTLLQRP